jgi:hypothetical protein
LTQVEMQSENIHSYDNYEFIKQFKHNFLISFLELLHLNSRTET